MILGFPRPGAPARVYLAVYCVTTGVVAILVPPPAAARTPAPRAGVSREARAGPRVRHPNVVKVLGDGVTPWGLPYVVMEALTGDPLDAFLRKKGRVELDLALEIVREAAYALSAAHDAGVVHRDVKPGNLFVRFESDGAVSVKLLDFGLAKLWLDEPEDEDPHTVLGTIEYMAPEQIVVESVDARADLYSLGVVLFRLVTGHLPFETDAGPMVLRHQLFSPVPPPSWLDEGMDPRVEALILNATRKHPDNRYPTMAAFVADLEAILEHADREVGRRPHVRTPDVYVPTTERGREALRVLSQKFGPYASQPPPS
jgi:serine/threonine-protein kinase